MFNTNNGYSLSDIAAVTRGNDGFGGFGDGNGAWWLILLFLFAGGGWGGFGGGYGGYGNMMLGYDFPWLLNGQNAINANTDDGFNHAATQSALGNISGAITAGFGDVQNALCSGFAGVNATVNGAQNALAQQLYTNQIADLERSFASQTASTQGMNAIQGQLAQCCCDNRAATADLKYTVATEACADRAVINDALRDVIAANTASTQRILDQLCQDKIDAKNDTIAQLRQELLYARGQASQDVQTARLLAGQTAEVDALYDRLNTCPVPTTPVYGRTPIFTCNNGCGCSNAYTGFVA